MEKKQKLASIVEEFTVQDDNAWNTEEVKELKTIRERTLKLSRISHKKYRTKCMAFAKNRKSLAFDIEMVPIVVSVMVAMTPPEDVPAEFRALMTELRKCVIR